MVGAEDSMRAWLSNKTVRHFLKIYSTVFLCVFIVTAVACAVFVRYSYRDSVKLVREQLTESVQRLNREIFTVTETATNLASNYQVVLLANTQLPFSRRQTFMVKNAITQFSEGFKFQSIMENYGLIMKNGGVLCANQLHNSVGECYGTFLREEGYPTAEEWLKSMQDISGSSCLRAAQVESDETAYDAVLFILPFSSSYYTMQTTFFAYFSTERMREIIGMDSMLDSLTVSVPDGSRVSLISKPGDGKSSELIRVEGLHGLAVQARVSHSLITASLGAIYLMVFLVMVSYLLVGCVMAVFFVRNSAVPLLKIVDEAQKNHPVQQANADGNAFDSLTALFRGLHQEQLQNTEQLSQQQELLRQSHLELLLCNPYTTDHERTVAKWFPDFPRPFRLILLKLNEYAKLNAEERAILQSFIRQRLSEIPLVHFQHEYVVCILGNDVRVDDMLQKAQSGDLRYAFEPGRIAVSGEFNDTACLFAEYSRLRFALEAFPETNGAPYIMLSGEPSADTQVTPLTQNHRRFSDLILHNRMDEAFELFKKDFSEVRKDEYVQLFYNYRNEFVLLMESLPASAQTVLPQYAPGMNWKDALQTLMDAAVAVHEELHRQMLESYASGSRDGQIIAYLNESFRDPNLCVSYVTEALGITETQLQNAIRRFNGDSFHSFIEKKRMKYAADQLQKTDLPIAQILQDSGYVSTSAFYRAFKLYYGVSPSCYRSAKKEEES